MNSAADESLVAIGPNDRWPVRFLPLPRNAWGGGPKSTWRWTGTGEILVENGTLTLDGGRRRLFMTPAKQKIQTTLGHVRNVAARQRMVEFEVMVDGRTEPVRVQAADAQAAQAIAAALPSTRTAEFATAQAEKESFETALDSLGTRPVVTQALVVLNVLVFIAVGRNGGGWFTPQPDVLIHWGSNFGPATLSGQWWRLLTSTFLHFGFIHLALNMWVLWSLGSQVERMFGSIQYAVVYLFAGLTGSLASLWWHPTVNGAGASGAIFGVLGGVMAFVLKPSTRVPPTVVAKQRASGLAFIFYNLLNGAAHQGIDNAAHLGGLVGGFLMGWALAQPLDVQEREEQTSHLPAAICLGIAALVALAWPLTKRAPLVAAELRFREDLPWIGERELQAEGLSRNLQQQLSQQKLTLQVWGRRTEAEVVPIWKTMDDRLLEDPLPQTSTLIPLRTALLKFVQERALGLSLAAEAATTGDQGKKSWAYEVLQRSDATAGTVSKLVRQLQ